MPYYIYKLKFPHGIHIGKSGGAGLEATEISLRSDTFYSAVYHEYMKLYEDDVLCEYSKEGSFKLSDLLPFKNDVLYLPKPFKNVEGGVEPTADKKKVKALTYLPFNRLNEYFSFLKTGKDFPEVDTDFGHKQLHAKNQISRQGEDTEPYSIEIFRFNKESGLYFIAEFSEEMKERFDIVLDSLSLTGVGGKKSSGYGQFQLEKEGVELKEEVSSEQYRGIKLSLEESKSYYLLLSSYAPSKEEVELVKKPENFYQLIKRSGFVTLPSYSNSPQKRKQIYMISSGSVLNFRPKGEIVDLKLHGDHSIYRMGKPLVMGVE